MHKSPIVHSPDVVSYVRILARSLCMFPLYHNRRDDGESCHVSRTNELRDGDIETGFEILGRVVQQFTCTVGGDGVGVGTLSEESTLKDAGGRLQLTMLT